MDSSCCSRGSAIGAISGLQGGSSSGGSVKKEIKFYYINDSSVDSNVKPVSLYALNGSSWEEFCNDSTYNKYTNLKFNIDEEGYVYISVVGNNNKYYIKDTNGDFVTGTSSIIDEGYYLYKETRNN